MKIIGGELKGRNFYMPAHIRPTQNMTREAVFDFTGHDLSGIKFLELFAGSGAVGLEAISRGAESVIFVERDPKCYDVIRENIDLLLDSEKAAKTRIINSDVFAAVKVLAKKGDVFDVLFIDPPYEQGQSKKALKVLEAYDILHANSLVIIETHKKEILPEQSGRFLLFKQKNYGLAKLWIYQVKG